MVQKDKCQCITSNKDPPFDCFSTNSLEIKRLQQRVFTGKLAISDAFSVDTDTPLGESKCHDKQR
jgi:hypothetical protein